MEVLLCQPFFLFRRFWDVDTFNLEDNWPSSVITAGNHHAIIIGPALHYGTALKGRVNISADSIPGFPADVLLFEPRRIASLAGLLISGFALVYVLFFALPFESTYTGSDSLALVDRGAYALCRHPGFWMFAAFYFFLWRYFTGNRLFAGFLLYTACNFLYVYVQDKYIFPQYIQGYEQYRHNVPFLLPTRQHIKNAFLPKRA